MYLSSINFNYIYACLLIKLCIYICIYDNIDIVRVIDINIDDN